MMQRVLAAAVMILAAATAAAAATVVRVDVPVRGRTQSLTVYVPPGTARGTILMGSGDVGWVGLGVTMAEFLSGEGYIVVGVNVRQYLSSYTAGKSHLETKDPPLDYAAFADALRRKNLLREPVILSGVSEGAALAVLAASSAANHPWVRGVITMGVPATAELAWKWSDFTAWITKTDVREPSFAPEEFIGSVSPLPIVMIQSRRDEYVPEADYRRIEAAARPPKKLVLIDAGNHRFTDRRQELQREYLAALAWVLAAGGGSDRH